MFSSTSNTMFGIREDYTVKEKTYSFLIVEDIGNLCTYFTWFKKDGVGLTITIPETTDLTLRDIMVKLYCSFDDAYVIVHYLKDNANIETITQHKHP